MLHFMELKVILSAFESIKMFSIIIISFLSTKKYYFKLLIKDYFFRFLQVLIVLLFFSVTMQAQNTFATNNDDTTLLRVGIAGSEPFIIKRNNDVIGISIEIWRSVASDANWHYTTLNFKTVHDALQNLEEGKIDVVVGPVSITAVRAQKFTFTQPYYQSSLSIVSRTDTPTLWQRVSPFFSMKLLVALIIFIFILSCVGTLLWLAERKRNSDQFPPTPTRGIANGMWCAIVTMSTTGYGDIAPRTSAGRIIAGSWMVISIIFATSMVAGIASTLTLTGMSHSIISKADQLNNKKIAVTSGSPASEFIAEYGGKEIPMANIEEGFQLLKSKKADAMVFDRPQILYYLKRHHYKDVSISQSEYLKQGYGFVFPLKSQLAHTLNIYLLHSEETGKTDRIINEWLGSEEE